MREITMTIPQFNAFSRGEITLAEIKKINGLETVAERILNDKRLTNLCVFLVGNLNYCQSFVSASPVDGALEPINVAGGAMLTIVQTASYWLCLLMCLIEILRALMNGQGDKCGKIVIRYVCIFAFTFHYGATSTRHSIS